MKKFKIVAWFFTFLFIAIVTITGQNAVKKIQKITDPQKKIKIAVQAWSFNRFSFEEAVQEAAKIGFKYIEMYSGQKIKKDGEDNTNFTMSNENRELVKSILKKNEIKLVQYGVITCNTKEEWTQLFEFAKAMGIETINSEPEFTDFDLLDSLTQAYKINLAVHNHANPNRYWDPQIVLDQVKGKNSRLGACADNGHWMRSGLDPVESLKKFEGRLITMHIKDVNEFDNLNAHTVPFGTGVLKVDDLIGELKRQKFSGVLTLEYEYNWETPQEDIKKSLENLQSKL